MIDFLGIGAMKAGSNWQRRWLATHPDIFLPGEEVHYWDGRRGASPTDYHALYADAADHQRKGDITPGYAILPREVLQRVQAYNSQMRLFYCLRNPIDRMWAHIRMGHDQGRLDLLEASSADIILYLQRDKWQRQGAYAENIARWHEVFGEEALFLFLFDDMVDAPGATLCALARHIGVDAEPFENLVGGEEQQLRLPVFAAEAIAIPGDVLSYLQEIYAPPIAALGHWLGRSLDHWIEAPTCLQLRQG